MHKVTMIQIAEELTTQANQMLADNKAQRELNGFVSQADKMRRAAAFTLQAKANELVDRANEEG